MRVSTYMLLFLLSLTAIPAQAKEPTDAELDDWMNYLRSVGIPGTVKICGPVLGDEPGFKSTADSWSLANQASVARGKALASANPPKGWQSLDDYNAAMIKDYETKLSGKPANEKVEICTKYLSLLEKRADGQ